MSTAIGLCKVLLVTDCSELRNALGFTLDAQAEQILAARNVREGKEMIAQHCDIDLVIADVLLPDGDGFALLRCVSLLEEPKPRVILIAGLPSPEDERRARAAGAVGYLAKPISYRDISGVLRMTWRAYTALLTAYEYEVIDKLGSDDCGAASTDGHC